jgi:hypothetical protein
VYSLEPAAASNWLAGPNRHKTASTLYIRQKQKQKQRVYFSSSFIDKVDDSIGEGS